MHAPSVVVTEGTTFRLNSFSRVEVSRYCDDDDCPVLHVHPKHNVAKALDQTILLNIPDGKFVEFEAIHALFLDMDPVRLKRIMQKLVDSGSLGCLAGPAVGLLFYKEGTIAQREIDAIDTYADCPYNAIKAPKKLCALDECILRRMQRNVCKVFWQIYNDVICDFGETTQRTVHRSLARLIDNSYIVRLEHESRMGGYVLMGSPLINDPDTAREQILVAYLERRNLSDTETHA